MAATVQYFRTVSGEPPNGGVPPGIAFYPVYSQRLVPTPARAPPPPYAAHESCPQPDLRAFLPPQQTPTRPPPYMQDFPFHVQLSPAPPPPAPPAPSPPPARWSPPGASLLGHPAPSFAGVNYLYARHHTLVHIIMDKFMQLDTATRLPKWDARLFPTGLTVEELIDVLGAPPVSDGDKKEDQPRKKYGLMEVHELGGGRWAAGQVVLRGSERAGKTLREMGWVETRGFEAKPVWLKIHEEGI